MLKLITAGWILDFIVHQLDQIVLNVIPAILFLSPFIIIAVV